MGDATQYCQSCDISQLVKRNMEDQVPLGETLTRGISFRHIAIDLIGEFVPSLDQGHRWIISDIGYGT